MDISKKRVRNKEMETEIDIEIKFPFKRMVCQVYEVKCHKESLCDRFVLFLRVKHHSERLVMLDLTNHVLPEQALIIVNG